MGKLIGTAISAIVIAIVGVVLGYLARPYVDKYIQDGKKVPEVVDIPKADVHVSI
jgi:hypothetical protein